MSECYICGSDLDFEEYCTGNRAHDKIRELGADIERRKDDYRIQVNEIVRLQDLNTRYKAALEKIKSNELTQPSEIGPLHSAGISLGLQIQADIAQEALKETK